MNMLEPATQLRTLDASGAHPRRPGAQADSENLPDLLLIERARGGDERAIEALIRRYGRRLFRVARSVVPDEERAEAAVFEAYVAAFGDLNRYEPNGKFAAWLTRFAFNQARALRASVRSAHAGAVPRPAETQQQERHELEQRIGTLPEVFRTVFVLRVVEGISGIETAASLGLHDTTVRTRLYRAHRRLGPEVARRVQAAPGLFELSATRLEQLVSRVLAARPHGSMATISASPP
jgi:RNA polymerase sigma-70 factor (ECF subfamily)